MWGVDDRELDVQDIDAQNRCALSTARREDCKGGCPGEKEAREGGKVRQGTARNAQRATRRG